MGIYRIREHVPAFVSGFEPRMAEFSTKDEFEAIEFVKVHSDNGYEIRYSESSDPYGNKGVLVMAVGQKGDHWHVVAYGMGHQSLAEFFENNGYRKWEG